MRLGAFELNEPLPELKEPQALVMLKPWVDVGNVGTMTLSWLKIRFKAKELARLARPGNFSSASAMYFFALSLLKISVEVNGLTLSSKCIGSLMGKFSPQ